MRCYCTLSDKDYLVYGLALYNSLSNVTRRDSFCLYYLCLDTDCFNKLTHIKEKFKLTNLFIINLSELEKDKELHKAKDKINADAGRPGKSHYCWLLASYFCDYLLNTHIKDRKEIMYVDSDIYFYKSPEIIFDEIGSKSVGIIKHRHNEVGDIDGAYNVGIIYFKNCDKGREVLKWWRDGVLYEKYPEYATCGDQKYLEGFIPNFGEENICVIDETVGHGAPWNFRLYRYPRINAIEYDGKEQPLIFNHFSRIQIKDWNKEWPENNINFTSGHYPDHTLGFTLFNHPTIRKYYTDYVKYLKFIKKKCDL